MRNCNPCQMKPSRIQNADDRAAWVDIPFPLCVRGMQFMQPQLSQLSHRSISLPKNRNHASGARTRKIADGRRPSDHVLLHVHKAKNPRTAEIPYSTAGLTFVIICPADSDEFVRRSDSFQKMQCHDQQRGLQRRDAWHLCTPRSIPAKFRLPRKKSCL